MLTVRDHHCLRLAFTLSTVRAGRVSYMAETGYSETAFWARINYLIAQPDALESYPREVRRLLRLRDRRRAARRGAA